MPCQFVGFQREGRPGVLQGSHALGPCYPSQSAVGIALGQMGVHVQAVKVKVSQELGYMHRMSRGARNWAYATVFGCSQGFAITGGPATGAEKKGDLLELALAFVSIAPFYPGAFGH